MGLSVVHGIVKSSGGGIRVFSNPGRYTEFHIYLPTVDTVIDEKPADLGKQLPGGGEHILLVDDEEMLVDMMQQVLEQLGYTVSAHADSSTAYNAFRSQPLSYDLLITDMTMPGMNGIELTRALKAVRADFPVILCTGFNEQVSEKNAQSMGIQALLMKPVGMQQLAETIRSVLFARFHRTPQGPTFSRASGKLRHLQNQPLCPLQPGGYRPVGAGLQP